MLAHEAEDSKLITLSTFSGGAFIISSAFADLLLSSLQTSGNVASSTFSSHIQIFVSIFSEIAFLMGL